jgi:decaprenyl-phosphate phosphoribosyltransferase
VLTFLSNFFHLIRIKHWIKNCLVFLPAFFAGKINLVFSKELLFLFLSFSFLASTVYVFNDLIDKEKDLQHPTKKNRPIANGYFNVNFSLVLIIILLFISLIFIDFKNTTFLFLIAYFILNVLYSLFLKSISILDVSCISVGYVLRVFAGGVAINVYVSHWLVIVVFLLSISILFAKRRDDLVLNLEAKGHRNSLNGYTIPFLDIIKSITFSMTLIAYIFYSISSEVTSRIGSDKLYLTSFFVFIGILRYMQLSIVDEKAGSPVDVLFKDRFLQITILAWFFTFTLILYGKNL